MSAIVGLPAASHSCSASRCSSTRRPARPYAWHEERSKSRPKNRAARARARPNSSSFSATASHCITSAMGTGSAGSHSRP